MITIQKYGAKDWAVYEGSVLLAVCRYKKGAFAVQQRLDELQARLHELERRTVLAQTSIPFEGMP